MGQSVTNTFLEGMNKDLDKSLVSNKSYLEANNFRVVTTDGGTTGSLENIKGNKHIATVLDEGDAIVEGLSYFVIEDVVVNNQFDYNPGDTFVAVGTSFTGDGFVVLLSDRIADGQMIIGSAELRDYIILFTTDNTSTTPTIGQSCIYKLVIDKEAETQTSLTLIYDDNLNAGTTVTDFLKFSTAHPIKAIGRHETTNIQKVYWTDGYNNVRYVICSNNLTKNGGVYVAGTNPYMTTDKFELTPNFSYTKPIVTDIITGTIYPGMVQYTYQLYRSNGAETVYSPLSDILHITDSDDFEPNSKNYKGSADTSTVSGKGCKITINNTNNVGFDRVRVIRIHYASLNAVPNIDIVSEEIINSNGDSFTVMDTGVTLGELTVDQLSITAPNLFAAEDIAAKDNRLFASNITESVFDVGDFDSRAVRFRNYTEPAGGVDETYIYTEDLDAEVTVNHVDDNTIQIVITTWPTWASIPGSRTVTDITDVPVNEVYVEYTTGVHSYNTYINTGITIIVDSYAATTLTFHIDTTGSIFGGYGVPSSIDYVHIGVAGYEYTYTSVGGTVFEDAKVIDNENGTLTIDVPTDPDILADWDTAHWDDYSSTHDGINLWNDPQYFYITGIETTPVKEFIYQTDLTTVGAEGPNVLLAVELEDMVIDEVGSADYTYYANIVGSSLNPSYSNYASPFLSGNRSWQREEVYRFFAVYHNVAGETSFPQWVCDFKMPGLTETHGAVTYELCTTTGGETVAHLLRMKVTFRNLPTGAVSAQIYAVPRDSADRSVVTQALATPIDPTTDEPIGFDQGLSGTDTHFKIVSPEININQNLKRGSTDYIQHVGSFARVTTGAWGTAVFIHKCQTFTPVAKGVNNETDIDGIEKVTPTDVDITYSVGAYLCKNFNSTRDTYGCTGYMIDYTNASWTGKNTIGVLVNYRRNVFLSQYGGNTYEVRTRNYCRPVSEIITSINMPYDVYGGDTFINFFDVNTLIYDLRETGVDSLSEAVYVPCESTINCDLRHDMSMHRLLPHTTNYHLIQETAGNWEDGAVVPNTLTQDTDLYQYNTVYSQQSTLNYKYAKPIDWVEETEFDITIKASDIKLNGELSDSWTDFPVNNFIEVDSEYGPVNAIHTFNNNLYYFQDNGFGLVSVNPRSLITDNQTSQLVLGTGGLLDRYDYISEEIGCQDKFGIAKSKTSMYWFDKLNKSVHRMAKEFITLSRAKYMQSHFDTSLEEDHLVLFAYDKENDEVLMTFVNDTLAESYTITYQETMDAFTSFYSCIPTIYIPYKNKLLTTTSFAMSDTDVDREYIFIQNSTIIDRCQFWAVFLPDATKFVDSSIEILFNPEYLSTKVFDNFHLIANAWNGNNTIHNECFDTIQCYNDYQNTTAITLTYEGNLRRRERGWTTYIPRNAVDVPVANDPNIFVNTDVTRPFKGRMRDKYLITDLVYNNGDAYDKFVFSNITLYYRKSFR